MRLAIAHPFQKHAQEHCEPYQAREERHDPIRYSPHVGGLSGTRGKEMEKSGSWNLTPMRVACVDASDARHKEQITASEMMSAGEAGRI